jgi:hypothetical protein
MSRNVPYVSKVQKNFSLIKYSGIYKKEMDSNFLNESQHFIMRFNKISLLCGLKEGLGGERRPKDRVNLRISILSKNHLKKKRVGKD